MTNNENAPSKDSKQHSDVAIAASIWFLLLASIVVIEIGSLFISRTTLTALLHN